MKDDKTEKRVLGTVTVNEDPNEGPLDGAGAEVLVARTTFCEDSEGKPIMRQKTMDGRIKASYELGVVSISVPEEGIMLTARIDEMMQVMFASAGAYKKLHPEDGKPA